MALYRRALWGTGTPVCGGLSSHQAIEILRGMVGINLIGMDLVEVAPAYDVSEITALAGATLAMEMINIYANRPGLPVPWPGTHEKAIKAEGEAASVTVIPEYGCFLDRTLVSVMRLREFVRLLLQFHGDRILQKLDSLPLLRADDHVFQKYAKSGLSHESLQYYKRQLFELMLHEQTYLHPDMTLPKLSNLVQYPVNHLSQVINAGLAFPGTCRKIAFFEKTAIRLLCAGR